MRILMVHPNDIYSPVEPWTRRVKSLAKEFVRQGHEVKLVYSSLSLDDRSTTMLDGYEAISFSRWPSPRVFFRNTYRLTKLAKWADVIHFQKCQYYSSIPAIIAAYFSGKPLHYDWDDWEEMIWYESCGRSPKALFVGYFFRILERLIPLLSDSVSVSSKGLSKLALQYGVNPQDIYRAPVGADLEEFSPKPGNDIKQKFKITGKLVLYVGQLSGAQYLDIFIEAANIVLHRFNGVQFMVVGGGFREEGLRSLAYKLGIEDKVLFVGAVPHADICAYIAAADICVASFKDTKVTGCKSPLKIVEYMSLAKPIVANNVGEVRNMLGGAGILVPPADARQLAKGVLKLLEDPQLGRKLGNLCLKRVQETYNWVNTASSILSAYQSLQPGQMSSRSAVVCDE